MYEFIFCFKTTFNIYRTTCNSKNQVCGTCKYWDFKLTETPFMCMITDQQCCGKSNCLKI